MFGKGDWREIQSMSIGPRWIRPCVKGREGDLRGGDDGRGERGDALKLERETNLWFEEEEDTVGFETSTSQKSKGG